MILSFTDDEKDIYNGILEVISNSKCLEWCNTFQDTDVIQVGALKIDLVQRIVLLNDNEARFSNIEFEILYLLASNPGRVFTTEQIIILFGMAHILEITPLSQGISAVSGRR